jgi:type 1 glutamine amidotransferase
VFYTSMGLPSDFTDPRFQRLLDNAVEWLATPRERD